MISTLDQPGLALPSTENYAALDPGLPRRDRALAHEFIRRLVAPIDIAKPSEWIADHIIFNEPEIKGPFNFTGRQYLRQPLDDHDDADLTDQTLIFGTGAGKTIAYMAGLGWAMIHEPFRGLYVMPSKEGEGGVREFNNTRFLPMLKATPCLAEKIPGGANRYKVKGLQVNLAGNVLGFVGANSAGQMGANRCGKVFKDEVDKFPDTIGEEAGAIYLADERTKGVPGAKRFASTTPTVPSRPGWQSLLKSDLRRRFLPCPHCNGSAPRPPSSPLGSLKGWCVLIWSDQFTVLPHTFPAGCAVPQHTPIPAAQMRWDKEAQRPDGSLDLDRVIASARFECPHCGGHLRDEHRVWMDAHGIWLPTQPTQRHYGYHLPSWYAPVQKDKHGYGDDFDSTFGGMAKKFLDSQEQPEGMRGWINSEAAEVDVAQEHGKSEITISAKQSRDEWIPLMTVDVQKNWPFLWFVIRKWSAFKLQPPLPLANGRPTFLENLTANPWLAERCEKIVAGHEPAWFPLCELLRFDPCTGDFPPLDWLIAQGITGPRLVALFRERCGANTLDLGRYVWREMGARLPRGGDSELIAAGHCDTDSWDELRDLFQHYHVGHGLTHANLGVLVDSGYGELNNPFVLRECYQTAKTFAWYDPLTRGLYPQPIHAQCKPCPLDNWQPYKGYPEKQRWKTQNIARDCTYLFADPFQGLAEADRAVIRVLSAATDVFFRQMTESRQKQTAIAAAIEAGKPWTGNTWTVAPDVQWHGVRGTLDEYKKHLGAKYLTAGREVMKQGGRGGTARKLWPDHLNDCETYQFPLARTLGIFSYETKHG